MRTAHSEFIQYYDQIKVEDVGTVYKKIVVSWLYTFLLNCLKRIRAFNFNPDLVDIIGTIRIYLE